MFWSGGDLLVWGLEDFEGVVVQLEKGGGGEPLVLLGSEEMGGWEGSLMESERDAGGPTGTMREPNSTPMVTSWVGEKRPSQRRIVS